MRALALMVTVAALALPVRAEMRNEEHLVADRMVRIAVFDTFEVLTVGSGEDDQIQVLTNADLEIVSFATQADSVALPGKPLLVVEGVGTQSCDEGDARDYWVVTLAEPPAPQGPLASCEALVPSIASGALVLQPVGDAAVAWEWTPGQGWAAAAR